MLKYKTNIMAMHFMGKQQRQQTYFVGLFIQTKIWNQKMYENYKIRKNRPFLLNQMIG